MNLRKSSKTTVKGDTPSSSTFIPKVNSFIQEVLGHRYSFLLEEMEN